MSRTDVERYFNECVFGFMEADIERELTFARTPLGGGNVLAALGLVAYTEAVGRILARNTGNASQKNAPNFNACFDLMGPTYRTWRRRFEAREKKSLYNLLRNGLAHEYAPKVPITVAMFPKGRRRVAIARRGRGYVLWIEVYLRDFRTAARRVYGDLMAMRNPVIPPPD